MIAAWSAIWYYLFIYKNILYLRTGHSCYKSRFFTWLSHINSPFLKENRIEHGELTEDRDVEVFNG